MIDSWFNLYLLALESQKVIALRLAKISLGGLAAWQESHLMVMEKVEAGQVAAVRLAQGATPNAIVRGYRKTVRANELRLSHAA